MANADAAPPVDRAALINGPLAEPVAPGVWRSGQDFVNWYLIEQDSRLTLVDAGLPGQQDALDASLAAIGHTSADVEAVVLTHVHPDHIGLAVHLQHRHRVGVYVHEREAYAAPRLVQRMPPRGLVLQNWRPFVFAYSNRWFSKGVARPRRLEEVEEAAEGAVLDVPGRPHLHWVGGHTAGSAAVVLDSPAIAFTGDALVAVDMRFGTTNGPQVMPDAWNARPAEAHRALDRLDRLEAQVIAPGHGPVVATSVREAVVAARSRLTTAARRRG